MNKLVLLLLSVFLLSCGGSSGDGAPSISDLPTIQDSSVQGKLGQTITCVNFSDIWDATCTDGTDSGDFMMSISQDSCSDFYIDAGLFDFSLAVGQVGNINNCTKEACYTADWSRGNTGFSATSVFREGFNELITSKFDMNYINRDQLSIEVSNTSNLNGRLETFSCTLNRTKITEGKSGN